MKGGRAISEERQKTTLAAMASPPTGLKGLTEYGLNPRQLDFVLTYVKFGGNGQRAVMEVYKPKSEDVASSMAWDLISNPKVKQALTDYLFHDLCSPNAVMGKFNELLHCGDRRIELQAADKLAKISGIYQADRPAATPSIGAVVNISLPENAGMKTVEATIKKPKSAQPSED